MNFLKTIIPQKIINILYHLPRAIMANLFFGFPTKKLKVIGITGTDGKTTTANMIYRILKDAGKKVSMISTINTVIAGKVYDTGFHVTSPDPFTIQKFAKDTARAGDEYLVLEVTSHAIDQYRVWGINFEVVVITNITHEHLDYHKTFENYFETKLRLVKEAKFAVINENIKGYWGDKGNMISKVITFGLEKGDFNQRELELELGISGDYNIENALCSFAVCSTLGVSTKIIKKSLQSFSSLSGRMQEVENNKRVKIIIDFAHTPNGLEQVLKTLKNISKGKLVAVFGAAGKRDVTKRPLMGEIAGKYADMVVLTAEDPRGERIEGICRQIAKGVEKSGKVQDKDYWIIADRKEAINFALSSAKMGDIVGVFGKGHERSMNIDGKKEIEWSDTEAVKRWMRN